MAQADREEILKDGTGDTFAPVLGGGGGGRVKGPTINVVVVSTTDHYASYGEALFATGYWAPHTEEEAEVFPGFPRLMQVAPMETGSPYWVEGSVVAGMMGETVQLLAGVPQVVEMYLEGWTLIRHISQSYQRVTGMPIAWANGIGQHPYGDDAGTEGSFLIPGGYLDTSQEARDAFNAEAVGTTASSTYDPVWMKCPYVLPAPMAAPLGTTPVGGGTP